MVQVARMQNSVVDGWITDQPYRAAANTVTREDARDVKPRQRCNVKRLTKSAVNHICLDYKATE